MSMPEQKPGRSKQDYGTPPEFITAVKGRFGIREFDIDLAATYENSLAPRHYQFDPANNGSLDLPWKMGNGWNWLNPPFAKIGPWVEKAYKQMQHPYDANTLVLVPASVGANWWAEFVHEKAYVMFLSPRLTFVGCEDPYPKDLALLVYGKEWEPGYECYRWK